MIWSDFELSQSFIVENSKQCIHFNAGCATKQASENSPNGFHSNYGSKKCCNEDLLKIVKN